MSDVNVAAGTSSGRRLVPALARGLRLLEVLAASDTAMTAAQLGRATELPRTTVHDLLQTLLATGYVRIVDAHTTAYGLGAKVLPLGHRYLNGLDLARAADPIVRRLSDATTETVQVAVLEGAEVLYVAKAESTNMLRLVSAVGRRLPAHLTGVGKSILAFQSRATIDALFAGKSELATMTERSIATVAQLRHQLDVIREEGFAYDECESNRDVCCVAAPIRDHTGAVVAGMSLSVPASRWTPDYRDELRGQLASAVAELSSQLGYSGER